jgi:hypothetical protein
MSPRVLHSPVEINKVRCPDEALRMSHADERTQLMVQFAAIIAANAVQAYRMMLDGERISDGS